MKIPQPREINGALIGLLVGVLVVGVLVLIVQTYQLASAIRATQKPTVETVDLIRDCTQPRGECFQRGQRQTANAVGDINLVTIYAASCGSRHPGQPSAVRRCVEKLLRTTP